AEILNNLRTAYHILTRNVIRTLRTQLGADAQLTLQVNEALQFLQAAEQVRRIFPPDELEVLCNSIATMLEQLDEACHLSSDPPEGPNLVVSTRVRGRGRPHIEIDPTFLREALALRGPTHLQEVFACDRRTIRCAALRYGLVEPGNPVYTNTQLADGSTVCRYASSAPAMSAITDVQLDTLVTSILQVFPDFGRHMLSGRLKAAGYRVPKARL
ncbi:hypothetical protein C8R43DRAFT_855749, partial [Mycena crocata]